MHLAVRRAIAAAILCLQLPVVSTFTQVPKPCHALARPISLTPLLSKKKGKSPLGSGAKKNVGASGRGFGIQSAPQPDALLGSDARLLLEQCRGDLGMAQAMYFKRGVMALQQGDPALFSRLMEEQRQLETGEKPHADIDHAVHSKLVELTWDATAEFLPAIEAASGALSKRMRSRMESIAKAVAETLRGVEGSGAELKVLDVGCGDGAILPFLEAEGVAPDAYCGVDLSGRMIAAAQRRHPRATFARADFLELPTAAAATTTRAPAPHPAPGAYACVLFNGSLQVRPTAPRPSRAPRRAERHAVLWAQFFSDPGPVLRRAAAMLERGSSAAKVLLRHSWSHFQQRPRAARVPGTARREAHRRPPRAERAPRVGGGGPR
jgi:SAM-dependent methyltransferase